MRRKYYLILFSLLTSLYIYLFYRTEKTVINRLVAYVFSSGNFIRLRTFISIELPLNENIVYSLPEGLWVFCATLVSRPFYIRISYRKLDLLFAPLLFSIGLELVQLVHFTNGHFDFWDVAFAVLFWFMAIYVSTDEKHTKNILQPFTCENLVCVTVYSIVYLSYVQK